MADDEEITVTIEPEVTGEVAVEKTTEEAKQADPVADLKGQFTELQATATRDREAREAAERARGEAERIAANAQREAAQARGQAADSQYDTVVSGLAAAQAEADASEREYKAAYEAGDATAMASAQRKMARAEARTVEYEGAKSTLEARAKQPVQAIEAPQRQQPSDPVEAYISGRTEPTARWLREHKDFITDTRKNAKLTAAHHDAVSEGLSADTDAYFEHVEKFVGLRKVEPVKQNGARKVSTPPVAPVGSPSGAANGGGATVTLTAGEAKAATDGITHIWNYNDPTGKGRFKKGDPIGLQEMARRKQALQKEGKYDRSYTES